MGLLSTAGIGEGGVRGMAVVGKVGGAAVTNNYSDRSVGNMKTGFIEYV